MCEGSLLSNRCAGSVGGLADGVTIDDQFHAPVPLTPFGSVIGRNGLRLAETTGGNRGRWNALLCQKIAHCIGPPFGQLLIKLIAANAVGMALNSQLEPGIGEHNAADLGQLFPSRRA